MKRGKLIVFSLVLLLISLSVLALSLKFTGFIVYSKNAYNITCVYPGTQTEGPNKTQNDAFKTDKISLYNYKTKKESKTRSDLCVKKKVKGKIVYYVKEVYCKKKDTKDGRRDDVEYKTKKELVLCENGCENGACKENKVCNDTNIGDIACFGNQKGICDFNKTWDSISNQAVYNYFWKKIQCSQGCLNGYCNEEKIK